MFRQTYDISVAKKQLDGIKQQGQAALDLIQTATASPAGSRPAHIGSLVNVVA